MADNQLDYPRIREYVEQHLKSTKNQTRLSLFLINLIFFVVFNGIAWVAMLTRGPIPDSLLAGLIFLSVGWLTGLIMHGTSYFLETRAGEQQMRERLTLRAIQKELTRLGMSELDLLEKPKRDQALRLSDDGELVGDTVEALKKATKAN